MQISKRYYKDRQFMGGWYKLLICEAENELSGQKITSVSK